MHISPILALWALYPLGSCSAPEPRKTYEGHKVYRVTTAGKPRAIATQLSNLGLDIWNEGSTSGAHLDVVVPAAQLADFDALGFKFRVLHDDLGLSIAAESSAPSTTWKRQVDDLAWYDSYHPYADHVEYFAELQRAFPENSELISSGTSVEGRDLYGLHLWGAGGPGKPAVLYHATVHAREWITTMVSWENGWPLVSVE